MIDTIGKENIYFKDSAVAIGKFDGFHSGHKLLIDAINAHKANGLKSVVFTFDIHPNSVFADKNFEVIYTQEEKRKIAEKLGVDVLIEYPFTEETARIEAEDFIKNVLKEHIGARFIAVGNDFRFGRARKGNAEMIKEMADKEGYKAFIADKKTTVIKDSRYGEIGTEVDVSSTLIRKAITLGDIMYANELLGRPYSIMGEVIHGKKIGRKLDMPTINMRVPENKLLPPDGVYTTRTTVEGKTYNSVTNIGKNPTVGDKAEKRVETYIIDFAGDLYDKIATVELYRYDRPEKKFDSLEALKAQMHLDKEKADSFFK